VGGFYLLFSAVIIVTIEIPVTIFFLVCIGIITWKEET